MCAQIPLKLLFGWQTAHARDETAGNPVESKSWKVKRSEQRFQQMLDAREMTFGIQAQPNKRAY